MRIRWWRRAASFPPRASRADIAILEHDLYGVQPQPNTMAAFAIGLRALSGALASSGETMARMTNCTATGTITLDGQPVHVICNRTPHEPDETHNDAVHGDWPEAVEQSSS